MPECRCRTEAVDYRKKCRCRNNFFRHLRTYIFSTSYSKNNASSCRLWMCTGAGCIPFHYKQLEHAVGTGSPFTNINTSSMECRECPFPLPAVQYTRAGCAPSVASSVHVQCVYISVASKMDVQARCRHPFPPPAVWATDGSAGCITFHQPQY
jgi:hypothetical protein